MTSFKGGDGGSFGRKISDTFSYHGLALQIIIPFLLLITLAIAFLSWAFYQYNIADLEQLSINNTRRQLTEVNYSVDSYIDNMKSMGRVVVDNYDVRQLLAFYNTHKDTELTESLQNELDVLMYRASTHMGAVASTREEITNIAIAPKYGDPVLSNRNMKVNPNSNYRQSDWFLKPLSYRDIVYISSSHVQNLIEGEYRWVISISQVITDPFTGDVTGVMLIDLNYAAIEKIFDNAQLDKGSYVYLIDSAGEILSHPQQQLVYSGIKSEPLEALKNLNTDEPFQKNDRIYLKNTSTITGWSTIGVTNTKELLGNRLEITVFYALISISTLLFATIVSVVISNNVTKPIRKLQEKMDKARTGDLTVRAEISANNEVGQLSDSFNVMISQVQNLLEQAVADEKEKRTSEIRALQSQINPHFLYNTLDTIIWMAARGKNDDVMEVTSALAHLFRTSISQGETSVPVATEIENIENYLVIQKMRYQDKLTYKILVGEGTKHLFTPKLLLQPIVENALYHGIKPSLSGGTIWINIYREEDALIFRVEDNGVGIPKEKMGDLLIPSGQQDHGIGVVNVHERIRLLFGSDYGLYYQQRPEGGTIVKIKLPIVSEGDVYA